MKWLVSLYILAALFSLDLGTNDPDCLVMKEQCNSSGYCEDVWLPCGGCEGVQYRCPDGRCVDLDEVCKNFTCAPGEKLCAEKQCIPETSRCCDYHSYKCGGSWCTKTQCWCAKKSGQCQVCESQQRKCPNGECINPGEICYAPCPDDEFECPDGSCAASGDQCWCNSECHGRQCAYKHECRKQCPQDMPHLCDTGQCVGYSSDCPQCGEGLIYCFNGSCIDPRVGQFCRECENGERRCMDGSCIPQKEKCLWSCWPGEYLCSDGRCVTYVYECNCPFVCSDGTCVFDHDECEEDDANHWTFPHTLQGLYLYVPLVIIMSGAVIFVCVLKHRSDMDKRNAQKQDKKQVRVVCKSQPSHFPVPLVALDTKPRVRDAGPPPPVWQPPDVEIEVQDYPTPQLHKETTFSEEVEETSLLLTKPC